MEAKRLDEMAIAYSRRYAMDLPTFSAVMTNLAGEAFVVDGPINLHSILEAAGYVLSANGELKEDPDNWAERIIEESTKSVALPFSKKSPSTVVSPSMKVASKPRKSGRVYDTLARHLLEGGITADELVEKIMSTFGDQKRATVKTFATDLRNSKYTAIKDRTVIKLADGRLIFKDCLSHVVVDVA